MIEARTLEYEFDEERHGFGEPPTPPPPPRGVGGRISTTVILLGLAMLVLGWRGEPVGGSWWGLVLSWGAISAGLCGLFWSDHAGTVPGIRHDGIFFRSLLSRGGLGFAAGLLMTGFYVLVYWYPAHLEGGIRMVEPLAQLLTGQPATKWFFYGFLYTLAVSVFGVRMFFKYRHSRYHQVRTASVMFFQFGLAFVLPGLLQKFQQPEFYFSYFWPLKYQYLWPSDIRLLLEHPGGLGTFMVFWGVVASFILTPVLTYFFGKRWYCSWVCGCGGLAETLGDPWRQLSSKSERAWRIERWMIHLVLVVIVITTGALWINSASEGRLLGEFSSTFSRWYGFYIGAVFSGVVGVGFYPLMGSRVWCRFGCPMAAILGLIQRVFSRFRITTNGGQCISCGNCSTYCEMGIDVRAYAQRGENIVRASCVGCGVCAAVCPRGVLKLENGPTHATRFDGSENPLATLRSGLRKPDLYEYQAWNSEEPNR